MNDIYTFAAECAGIGMLALGIANVSLYSKITACGRLRDREIKIIDEHLSGDRIFYNLTMPARKLAYRQIRLH